LLVAFGGAAYLRLTWFDLPLQVAQDPLTAPIGWLPGICRSFSPGCYPRLPFSFGLPPACLPILGGGRFFMDRRLPWSVPEGYLVLASGPWLYSLRLPPFF